MKVVGIVGIVIAASTASAHAEPELRASAALRVGVHTTAVHKDDGAPDAWGPRIEASGELAFGRYVSAALVIAASWYSDEGLYDGVTSMSYDLEVRDLTIGLRVLFHPHPRVFAGLGLHKVFTRERFTLSGGGTGHIQSTTPELIAGVNVASVHCYQIQVVATAGAYSRFDGLEDVEFATLAIGVQR